MKHVATLKETVKACTYTARDNESKYSSYTERDNEACSYTERDKESMYLH
jgi:hypothetical protein